METIKNDIKCLLKYEKALEESSASRQPKIGPTSTIFWSFNDWISGNIVNYLYPEAKETKLHLLKSLVISLSSI